MSRLYLEEEGAYRIWQEKLKLDDTAIKLEDYKDVFFKQIIPNKEKKEEGVYEYNLCVNFA